MTLRTTRRVGLLVCVLSSVLIPAMGSVAQVKGQADPRVAELLEKFDSPDSSERARAFYSLLDLGALGGLKGRTWLMPSVLKTLFQTYPEQEARMREALIRLLEREDAVVEESAVEFRRSRGARRLSEDFVNYWGDLIAAVAALQDPRAIPGLLGAINTGGMAGDALAEFGPLALDAVIEKFHKGDEITRMSATAVISRMLDPGNRQHVDDAVSLSKIRSALLRGASDTNPFVRRAAVEGLGKLGDLSVKPLLERMAREDPYEGSKYGGRKGLYPVREAAKKALQKLK